MASFKSAFASARKAGKKTFDWNGKKYTTKLKSEAAKSAASPKKTVPVPQSKPKQGTGSTPKSGTTGQARVPKPSPRPQISGGSTPKSGVTKPSSPKESPKTTAKAGPKTTASASKDDKVKARMSPEGKAPAVGIAKAGSPIARYVQKLRSERKARAKQAEPKGGGGW